MVTAALRELIVSGELSAGASLRQRDLADSLGVSLTPVREALTRLQWQGLVRVDAHRGVRVAESDLGALVENVHIRAALEGLAAALAAGRVDGASLEALASVNSEIRALPAGDRRRYLELNQRFHSLVYASAGSPTLLALLRLLWQAIPAQFKVTRPFSQSADQHDEILAAMKPGDGALASSLIRSHILSALDDLPGMAGA
jgi:DNA-binding GntR family transcriptional regulator